jgi:hypothetical protein
MVQGGPQGPEELLNIGQGIAEIGLAGHCTGYTENGKSGLASMDETQC